METRYYYIYFIFIKDGLGIPASAVMAQTADKPGFCIAGAYAYLFNNVGTTNLVVNHWVQITKERAEEAEAFFVKLSGASNSPGADAKVLRLVPKEKEPEKQGSDNGKPDNI